MTRCMKRLHGDTARRRAARLRDDVVVHRDCDAAEGHPAGRYVRLHRLLHVLLH